MALMTCNYYSQTLKNNHMIQVFIPTPEGSEPARLTNGERPYPYESGLPVVYLLHGAFGDCSSWGRFSNVERYAKQYGCALVMASAGNSFYQNMHHGNAYQTFFTEELPDFVTSMFPISKQRKDTYIAGFSMGGYGAWYLALSNPTKYCKAASMSGALDIALLYQKSMEQTITVPIAWSDIFANPKSLSGSNADLIHLYENCALHGIIPSLYQSCGKEDFLYEINLLVKEQFQQKNADLVYHESDGDHNWDYWDKDIKQVFDWMFASK